MDWHTYHRQVWVASEQRLTWHYLLRLGPLRRHEDNVNEVLDKYESSSPFHVLIILLPCDRYGEKISFYKDVSKIFQNLRLQSRSPSMSSNSTEQNVIIAACSRTDAPNLYVSKTLFAFSFYYQILKVPVNAFDCCLYPLAMRNLHQRQQLSSLMNSRFTPVRIRLHVIDDFHYVITFIHSFRYRLQDKALQIFAYPHGNPLYWDGTNDRIGFQIPYILKRLLYQLFFDDERRNAEVETLG
jgi:hypothetical protein